MDSFSSLAERSSMISRLSELDITITQSQWHLQETLQLIDRLRAHYLHIQEKFSDAERQRALLLTEVARLFDVSDVLQSGAPSREHGPVVG